VEQRLSQVGVLDKSVAVLDAVADAGGATLADLVRATGLSRATAHRLAVSLEAHGLLRRDVAGRFVLGLRLIALGRQAASAWPLADAAGPVLAELRSATGESAQLYVRDGDERLCVASLESPHELRTIVALGVRLPLSVGSAGRVLTAFEPGVWVESVEERAPGVASVSAGALVDGTVVAVGVSGPIERTTRHPGQRYGEAVLRAASQLQALAFHG
jgi:DNA-binding IclR family transcriptional regulator